MLSIASCSGTHHIDRQADKSLEHVLMWLWRTSQHICKMIKLNIWINGGLMYTIFILTRVCCDIVLSMISPKSQQRKICRERQQKFSSLNLKRSSKHCSPSLLIVSLRFSSGSLMRLSFFHSFQTSPPLPGQFVARSCVGPVGTSNVSQIIISCPRT